MQGTVKFLNTSRGFGYITPSGGSKDVNVRFGDIQHDGGYKPLSEGQKVGSEVSEGPQAPQAKNVRAVDLKGLHMLCDQKRISRAYVVARDMADFEVHTLPTTAQSGDDTARGTSFPKIPAPLACYGLSQPEHRKVACEGKP
ncbi:MAG: cold shock domain-containing protein [Planctomycetota bacterium]|jgi:CspA family cold shock protein